MKNFKIYSKKTSKKFLNLGRVDGDVLDASLNTSFSSVLQDTVNKKSGTRKRRITSSCMSTPIRESRCSSRCESQETKNNLKSKPGITSPKGLGTSKLVKKKRGKNRKKIKKFLKMFLEYIKVHRENKIEDYGQTSNL